METIEGLNELIKKRLIEKSGNVKLTENNDIVLYGQALGVSENQLLFKILDISETINWTEIEKKKQEEISLQNSNVETPIVPKIPTPVNNTIRCANCNAINDSGTANFCVECGAELIIEKEPIYNAPPVHNEVSYKSTNDNVTTKSKTPIIIAVVLGIIIALGATYFFWGKDYLRDKNAAKMYSFANSLALRSSPAGGGDYNMIANIPYGSEILVYDNGAEWVNCKVNNQEGYASPKYMISQEDFHELNAILADTDTRTAVSQTRYKKALLNYYRENNLIGKMDETIQQELYGTVSTNEVWQLFANAEINKPNTVYFSKHSLQNTKYNDFSCILKNINTGERKIVTFSFDENENPKTELADSAPENGNIVSIEYNYGAQNVSLTPMYTAW